MICLHVTAGRGPAECRLAVAGLLEALRREARATGVEAEVIEIEEAEQPCAGTAQLPLQPAGTALCCGLADRRGSALAAAVRQ